MFLTGFYIKVLWNDIRFVINRAETLRFSEEISTCIFRILSLTVKELGSEAGHFHVGITVGGGGGDRIVIYLDYLDNS